MKLQLKFVQTQKCYISLPKQFIENYQLQHNINNTICTPIKITVIENNQFFYFGFCGLESLQSNSIEIWDKFAECNNLIDGQFVQAQLISQNYKILNDITVYSQTLIDYNVLISKNFLHQNLFQKIQDEKAHIENNFLNTISILCYDLKFPIITQRNEVVYLEFKGKGNEFFIINQKNAQIEVLIKENTEGPLKKSQWLSKQQQKIFNQIVYKINIINEQNDFLQYCAFVTTNNNQIEQGSIHVCQKLQLMNNNKLNIEKYQQQMEEIKIVQIEITKSIVFVPIVKQQQNFLQNEQFIELNISQQFSKLENLKQNQLIFETKCISQMEGHLRIPIKDFIFQDFKIILIALSNFEGYIKKQVLQDFQQKLNEILEKNKINFIFLKQGQIFNLCGALFLLLISKIADINLSQLRKDLKSVILLFKASFKEGTEQLMQQIKIISNDQNIQQIKNDEQFKKYLNKYQSLYQKNEVQYKILQNQFIQLQFQNEIQSIKEYLFQQNNEYLYILLIIGQSQFDVHYLFKAIQQQQGENQVIQINEIDCKQFSEHTLLQKNISAQEIKKFFNSTMAQIYQNLNVMNQFFQERSMNTMQISLLIIIYNIDIICKHIAKMEYHQKSDVYLSSFMAKFLNKLFRQFKRINNIKVIVFNSTKQNINENFFKDIEVKEIHLRSALFMQRQQILNLLLETLSLKLNQKNYNKILKNVEPFNTQQYLQLYKRLLLLQKSEQFLAFENFMQQCHFIMNNELQIHKQFFYF